MSLGDPGTSTITFCSFQGEYGRGSSNTCLTTRFLPETQIHLWCEYKQTYVQITVFNLFWYHINNTVVDDVKIESKKF